MSSDPDRRPATADLPSTTEPMLPLFPPMSIKGSFEASGSHDIPVLPLISHPLKKKSSFYLTIGMLLNDCSFGRAAYNGQQGKKPMTLMSDMYVPYTSDHNIQPKRWLICASHSKAIPYQVSMDCKQKADSRISFDAFLQTPDRNSGSSGLKDSLNHLPQTTERNSGASGSKDRSNPPPKSQNKPETMSSDPDRRPATSDPPSTTGPMLPLFPPMSIKGSFGASGSHDIPVLPLISHPLKKKLSFYLSIGMLLNDCYYGRAAYNGQQGKKPMTLMSDIYVPYTSDHNIQQGRWLKCASHSKAIPYQVSMDCKQKADSKISFDAFLQTPDRNSGSSGLKDSLNHLPQTTERNSGASGSKDRSNPPPKSQNKPETMSSDPDRRPATAYFPSTTGPMLPLFPPMSIKGSFGASGSHDIPVLPLISHPLKKKSSFYLSIGMLLSDCYFGRAAYNGQQGKKPMTLMSDMYVPYTSDHNIQPKRWLKCASYSKAIPYQVPMDCKQKADSKISFDAPPQTPDRNSGSSDLKDSLNHLPQTTERNSGASGSKDISNPPPQSQNKNSGSSGSKSSPNVLPQTPKRNAGSSGSNQLPHSSKESYIDVKQSSSNLIEESDECISKCFYQWRDITASFVGVPVKGETEVEVITKPPPNYKRHPMTFSHLFHLSGKRRGPIPRGRHIVPTTSLQAKILDAKQPQDNPQEEKTPKPSRFKVMYLKGELPVRTHSSSKGTFFRWTRRIDDLDYNVYLPLFFEGLRYKEEPWCLFSRQGCMELMHRHPDRVLPIAAKLLKPIREAMETRNKSVMCHTLQVMQGLLLSARAIGRAIIPNLYVLFPILRHFLTDQYSIENSVSGEVKHLSQIITESLNVMELCGDSDTFFYIRLIIPTYKTCCSNTDY